MAYVAIPIVLIYFIWKRREMPFPLLFWLFGAFILTCGFTHLMDVIATYVPLYRLSGLIKVITAIASWVTVIALVPATPIALSMKSPRELEREIAERRRAELELGEKNRQLVEAERSKSEFFASVSHELRTPLTLILAPLESVLGGEFGQVSSAQQQVLQTVHNNAVRLLQMVSGVLDSSKLEAGKVEVRREALAVVALTRSVLADFAPVLQQRDLTATLEATPAEPVVQLDRYPYERILFNLLSNAVKFTPAGGKITVTLKAAAGRLQLAVKDTGIGIREEDRRALFQKFRQLEGSATRRYGGTGLGLALVREFATLLGGTVSVESTPGQGSTFTVDVIAPLVEPADADRTPIRSTLSVAAAGPLAEPADDGQPTDDHLPRVLIAEDNAELARYIQRLLRDSCSTSVAGDGEEALAQVRARAPDLVIADVMMPRRDGLSLCRAIKEDPATAGIPVVLLTALTHREALLKGWESGADEYLFKPFHPKELVTRIRTILAASRERQKAAEHTRQLAQEQAARAAAEEAVRARDHFLSLASHELRTPLNPLQLHVQLLLRAAREGTLTQQLGSHAVPMLEACERQVRQFSRLVNELLDVSRIVTGRLEIHRQDIDLAALARDVAGRFRPELEQVGCALELRADRPVCGHWDRSRLDQVLANLLSNALRYGKGKPIEVEVHAGPQAARLVVRDHGIGIAPENHGRIFERFERAVTGYEHGGLGLGLYIAREIVTAHGGTIRVDSRPGEGAAFIVELPYAPATMATGAQSALGRAIGDAAQ